jgi:hypothetical protein
MSNPLRNLLLSLLLASSSAVGCTLIAEVDRSKIPDEDADTGGGGEGGTPGEGGMGGAS